MFAFVAGFLDRLKRRGSGRCVEVIADADGVMVVLADRTTSPGFRWEDVTEIRTFKRDLGFYDDIRLAFEAGGSWHVFGEDLRGFGRLSEAIHEHFPSIPAGWYGEVMLPPFATNERVLYRGDAGVGDDARSRDVP